MIALLLQTLLLMSAAFFVGAALACGLRRLLVPAREAEVVPANAVPRAPVPAGAVEPLPQYAARATPPAPPPVVTPRVQPVAQPAPAAVPAVAPVSRFDDALKTRPVEPPRPAPPQTPAAVTPRVVEPAVRPAPAPPPPAAQQAARPAPDPVPAAPAAAVSPVAAIAAAAAAAAATTAALAQQARTAIETAKPAQKIEAAALAPQAPVAAPVVPAPASVAAASAKTGDRADDLTRISVIDAALNGQLEKLGVTRYAQIAAWRAPDVASISKSLGFQGRVEQENWIEQAQILAGGGETYYSARRARPATAAAPVAATVAAAAASAIAGVSAVALAALPRVADRAAFADATVATPSPAPVRAEPAVVTAVRPAVASDRDALQRIGGINAEIERLLAAQNVTRFSHIASWGTSDIERFDRLLGSQGRIARENWVEQAQILSKGGDTAHSREFDRRTGEVARDTSARPTSIVEAIRNNAGSVTGAGSRPDIAGLRSVRSEAYRPAADAANATTAAAAAAAASVGSAKVVRSAEVDDLKRIRGVGVLIEKRLNSLGIVSYGQIAEWTTDDIDRVSSRLDFKGRIERENWVEQARILAAGGQTEFSRRVDRGEVETSRPKG